MSANSPSLPPSLLLKLWHTPCWPPGTSSSLSSSCSCPCFRTAPLPLCGQSGDPQQLKFSEASQLTTAEFIGFGNRHWSLDQAGWGWGVLGFPFKLCQLTSEASPPLSQPKQAEATMLSDCRFLPLVLAPGRRGIGMGHPEPRGCFLPVSLHGEDSPHTRKSKEEAEEQLFLFIGGFLAEHLFGNCEAEFPLWFLPCCEGRMSWGKLQAKAWQRERLLLPTDAFGFEDFTLTPFCSWVEHLQTNYKLSLRLSPPARVKGASRGAGSLKKGISRAPGSGDALLCPSYWCSGCLGRFLLGVLVFTSGAPIPFYIHLPSCLTEEIWVRSAWSSCHGPPWDRVPQR